MGGACCHGGSGRGGAELPLVCCCCCELSVAEPEVGGATGGAVENSASAVKDEWSQNKNYNVNHAISHLAQLFLEEEEGAQTLEGVGGHPCKEAAQEEGDHPKEPELKKKFVVFLLEHSQLPQSR